MKLRLLLTRERRTRLIHKLFSFKQNIIPRLAGSLYALIIILTLTFTSCGIDLDSDGVTIMAAGGYHALAIKNDGTLWAWGRNQYGQLGDGTGCVIPLTEANNKSSPVQIKIDKINYPNAIDTDWKAVAAGSAHTVAIKNDGTLWAWGNNEQGQLGDGTQTDRNIPVQVGTDTDWATVGAGEFHTVATKENGELWAWGYNDSGQLGDNTTTPRSDTPVRVIGGASGEYLEDVIAVSAGGKYTVAIKKNGELWAWGNNSLGQLGLGATPTTSRIPLQVGTDIDWKAVATGSSHTVAIKKNGELWAWGWNTAGELGDGTRTQHNRPVQVKIDPNKGIDTDWVSVSVGLFHTIALKKDSTLWAWGWNNHGQLGKGTTEANTNIPENHSPGRLGKAADLVEVSGGYEYSIALRRSGILWTWGNNSDGQLGNGTNDARNIPDFVEWE